MRVPEVQPFIAVLLLASGGNGNVPAYSTGLGFQRQVFLGTDDSLFTAARSGGNKHPESLEHLQNIRIHLDDVNMALDNVSNSHGYSCVWFTPESCVQSLS